MKLSKNLGTILGAIVVAFVVFRVLAQIPNGHSVSSHPISVAPRTESKMMPPVTSTSAVTLVRSPFADGFWQSTGNGVTPEGKCNLGNPIERLQGTKSQTCLDGIQCDWRHLDISERTFSMTSPNTYEENLKIDGEPTLVLDYGTNADRSHVSTMSVVVSNPSRAVKAFGGDYNLRNAMRDLRTEYYRCKNAG